MDDAKVVDAPEGTVATDTPATPKKKAAKKAKPHTNGKDTSPNAMKLTAEQLMKGKTKGKKKPAKKAAKKTAAKPAKKAAKSSKSTGAIKDRAKALAKSSDATISGFLNKLIRAGKSTDESILSQVKKKFRGAKTSAKSIHWQRSMLRKAGENV